LILGAGVAGLQAIATAKRLGAQVEVFDVRSVAQEAVESLGAKFIAVPTEVEEMEEGGYAKETSEEYQKRQAELIERHIVKADLIITTASIPGKKAPVLISANMVQKMCPGAVIMDLAAENGGNCELTQPGKVIVVNKVIIDGGLNLPAKMSVHASKLYARNIINFVNHLFPKTVGANHKSPLSRIGQDEIITATVVQSKEG
jgi:NAD(P) transhydrogenase subunit alpha